MREVRRFAIVSVFFLVALFVGAAELLSQPPPPTLPGMPNQAPIDGGLGLLAVAGGAYAWRKLKRNRESGIGNRESGH